MGLQQWHVAFIIGMLTVIMTTSLAVFLMGLILFLVPLRVLIACVVGAITFISFAAYLVTNFLPVLYPSCPYKIPPSQYIFSLYAYVSHNISPISKYWATSAQVPEKAPIRVLGEVERSVVEASADDTDVHALSWLFSMSSNPSVQSIVVQAISALPSGSADSLMRQADGISRLYEKTLREVLSQPLQLDDPS
ncbi:uncharacterized protein BT62DRAFT_619217 [Guyanagaster necrorhizus]|uniref:Uncharacterized protein n=1 Tax=Guyanagaster necrorhizus TaxID=856835 RepID=A0A9P8AWB4_9AGAR|nr:uncharacterized protein BT62DRAFT_619217 [Guyanagaster necrorhizus MCA 3950]KAG7450006.1 hypothetical protein BT62DRAFT_619217 [Guyanagaster necrorhizus MCA 3950]